MTDTRLRERLLDTHGEGAVSAGDDGTLLVTGADGAALLAARETGATRPPVLLHELSELREAVGSAGAAFGALVAPGVEYAFRPETVGDLTVERTVPELPAPDGTTPDGARAFRSAAELRFAFHRLRNLDRPGESLAAAARKRKYVELVRALRAAAAGEDPGTDFERAVAAVFGAFDLDATEGDALASFVAGATAVDSVQRYSTRAEVAEFLVDLAGVGPDETVLDPAAGVGNVLRAAADRGAEAVGVEVDGEAVEMSRFFTDLLGREARVETADFLEAGAPGVDPDHVILEPPSTRNPEGESVGSLVTREGEHVEEEITAAAAAELGDDATLTALVPFGMLVRPDEAARAFRARLREEFRITTLLEVVNPEYYPYPGVRTGVLQLEPEDAPGDHEVRVARLIAGSGEGRFGAAEGKAIGTLFAETLEAAESGDLDTVPVSAFGSVLDPSDALRRERLEAELAAACDATAPLSAVAREVVRGPEIPRHEQDEAGLPYLRVGTLTGHDGRQGYVADPEEAWVARESDLLVSVKGTVGMLHVPEEPVVPGPEWAVVRLGSAAAAATYRRFFGTTVGESLREGLAESAVVPYPRYTPELTLDRLRSFVVPAFTGEQCGAVADALAGLGEDPSRDDLDDVFGTHAGVRAE